MKRHSAQSGLACRSFGEGGFLDLRTSIAILLCALAGSSLLGATLLGFFVPHEFSRVSERVLSVAERVSYQRAIEEVYWRHRNWPEERPDPRPPLDSVMSQAQLGKKVADYLREFQVLENQVAQTNHQRAVTS